MSRGGPGRTPIVRTQRSHSAGPQALNANFPNPLKIGIYFVYLGKLDKRMLAGPTGRKSSLPNRQVAALKSSTASPSPDIARYILVQYFATNWRYKIFYYSKMIFYYEVVK